MRWGLVPLLALGVAAGMATAAAAAPLVAQQPADSVGSGAWEMALLHEARAYENAGEMARAEDTYRAILKHRPGSLSSLIGLERLLSIEGRLQDMIPVIQRHLKAVPDSPIGRQMLLRIDDDLDRGAAFDSAANAWIRAVPRDATPYREIARLLMQRGKDTAAVRVLERGRKRLKSDDDLGLELGAAYAAIGRKADAVREWSRTIGANGGGSGLVRTQLDRLADRGASVIPGLVDALAAPPTSPGRLRAATELAVEGAMGPRALRLAARATAGLHGTARTAFLADLARRAETAQLPRVAYWAYGRLLTSGGGPADSLAVRSRMAELALLLGDTAQARSSLEAVDSSAPAGSAAKRRAGVQAVRLALREGDLAGARRLLARFRHDFTNAGETDALAGQLALALMQKGDTAAAGSELKGVRGPQSDQARGRLALEEGDIPAARAALLAAAPGLSGATATRAIALAQLVGRLSVPAARSVGHALRLRDTGHVADAVALLTAPQSGLPAAQQAALLAFAAGLADDARLTSRAMQIRRTLIAHHPDAMETPPAMLALARALAAEPGGVAEAKQLLQSLVVKHPTSVLVPQARQVLQRLDGHAPGD